MSLESTADVPDDRFVARVVACLFWFDCAVRVIGSLLTLAPPPFAMQAIEPLLIVDLNHLQGTDDLLVLVPICLFVDLLPGIALWFVGKYFTVMTFALIYLGLLVGLWVFASAFGARVSFVPAITQLLLCCASGLLLIVTSNRALAVAISCLFVLCYIDILILR